MKAIIIHGTGGSPEGNWFPWLKKDLEAIGYEVIIPRFPQPERQSLDSWMKEFGKYTIDEKTILVGHSIGSAFILNILENTNKKIKAAILVAGFTGLLDNDFDKYNKTIAERDFDWKKIKQHCDMFYVINSDNDPYVPLEKGKSLAKNLGSELIILQNAGHINMEFGITKLPIVLDIMRLENR